ncbi:MAG: hypothetical protein U0237_19845 [Thermoleophilia bacterium]
MASGSLVALYGFENEDRPGVHHAFKFALLTLSGGGKAEDPTADFVPFARHTSWLKDPDQPSACLPKTSPAVLDPNTGTCPTFRSCRDAEIAS